MWLRIRQALPFRGPSRQEREMKDVQLVQKMASLALGLNEDWATKGRTVTNRSEIKHAIRSSRAPQAALNKELMDAVVSSLDQAIALRQTKAVSLEYMDSEGKEVETSVQEWLRLQFCKEYLLTLQQSASSGDIDPSAVTPVVLERLVDSILVGTATERMAEHLRLYGDSLQQFQVQHSFYTLLEPEVKSCSVVFTSLKSSALPKHHKKFYPKYIKNYLLDTLELNVKSRCVFSWADPKFTGFQPLPDETVMALPAVLDSRVRFFAEADTVGHRMLDGYLGDLRLKYVDKNEFRSTVRNGIIFFFGTFVLDVVIGII